KTPLKSAAGPIIERVKACSFFAKFYGFRPIERILRDAINASPTDSQPPPREGRFFCVLKANRFRSRRSEAYFLMALLSPVHLHFGIRNRISLIENAEVFGLSN
ncbi:MAG TPA: hypothetical protein VIV82_04175, partial [Verrucomicrobiae bacterium]